MMTDERLTLPEELLLLGWADERGWNRSTENLNMLLAGAAVLELALREAVAVEGNRLRVVAARSGDALMDLVLGEIQASARPRTAKAWVRRLGNRRWVRRVVLEQLEARGVLRKDVRSLLGLVALTRHPVLDGARVAQLRERVARVLTQPEPVSDPRDAALGSLLHSAGFMLLRRLVPREQRGNARRRAKALSRGEAVSAEVAKAIGEANATMVAAMGAAGVAATSSGGGG